MALKLLSAGNSKAMLVTAVNSRLSKPPEMERSNKTQVPGKLDRNYRKKCSIFLPSIYNIYYIYIYIIGCISIGSINVSVKDI